MKLTLKVWRQKGPKDKGKLVSYEANEVDPDMSFLEMLDVVNEDLVKKGDEPIAFEHDCREGICGSCGFMVNGIAHGPMPATTVCQLHMRHFEDGQTLVLEPWRAAAFPVLKDLMVDRRAFDRVIESGGYISERTGNAPEANSIPVPKDNADRAFEAATCIGCGACVAACKNASAMLFVAAKVTHFAELPQGRVEAARRVKNMVAQMDAEGFGNCTNYYECQAVCPKEIRVDFIAQMNREFLKASAKS